MIFFEFFEFFVTNEIIFSENTCEIIGKIRTKYLEVWSAYSQKAFVGNDISPELNRKLIDDMKNAYQNVLEKEMQDLKTELKKDFRIQLGIINKETGANTR